MDESKLPQHVRAILARYDEGLPLEPHELLSVQMLRHGYGCASCRAPGPTRNPASAN